MSHRTIQISHGRWPNWTDIFKFAEKNARAQQLKLEGWIPTTSRQSAWSPQLSCSISSCFHQCRFQQMCRATPMHVNTSIVQNFARSHCSWENPKKSRSERRVFTFSTMPPPKNWIERLIETRSYYSFSSLGVCCCLSVGKHGALETLFFSVCLSSSFE